MGCGASTDVLKAKPAQSVDDVIADAALIGSTVHVVGMVGHVGKVLHSPFAEDAGVAIKVSWHMSGSQAGKSQHFFTAVDSIDFKVVSGDKEITVVAGSSWKFAIKETHKAWNIMKGRGGLVSGGTGLGQFSKCEPRPHAMPFFDAFNKKPHGGQYDSIPIQSESGEHAFAQSRPRKAFESVLKVGDRVAVLGTLREGPDRTLRLECDEGVVGMIANTSAVDKAVVVSASVPTSGEPTVEHMAAARFG